MRQTNNLHIVAAEPLVSPEALRTDMPASAQAYDTVADTREAIAAILRGEDSRRLVVIGPCSIHDPVAAMEYAHFLKPLADELNDRIVVLMRVYFEKPRTSIGWKGLINDPHLDGSCDMPTGMRTARRLLLELAEMGLPTATEILDPITPQYFAELISWAAVGARTTESQTHREMASGLSMPIGFKNSTDGSLQAAVNAMISARQPHKFLGINGWGQVSVVSTTGNANTHVVLRGSDKGPNYSPRHLAAIRAVLEESGFKPRVMVDCSHGNSEKDHNRQPLVVENLMAQAAAGEEAIMGFMIESNLV
ncbi:MAG: 3-deoxy-7-phosphoheptulonate synthase, partial [Planctomycetota bacterium]